MTQLSVEGVFSEAVTNLSINCDRLLALNRTCRKMAGHSQPLGLARTLQPRVTNQLGYVIKAVGSAHLKPDSLQTST